MMEVGAVCIEHDFTCVGFPHYHTPTVGTNKPAQPRGERHYLRTLILLSDRLSASLATSEFFF